MAHKGAGSAGWRMESRGRGAVREFKGGRARSWLCFIESTKSNNVVCLTIFILTVLSLSLCLCVSMFCAAVLRVYLDSAKKKKRQRQRQREERSRQRKIWKKVAEARKHAATMNVK